MIEIVLPWGRVGDGLSSSDDTAWVTLDLSAEAWNQSLHLYKIIWMHSIW
jgi:hypothetical protein